VTPSAEPFRIDRHIVRMEMVVDDANGIDQPERHAHWHVFPHGFFGIDESALCLSFPA
jgi:hypothetical protein